MTDGHEIALRKLRSPTSVTVQALASPVGSVADIASTATHSDADGHDTPVSRMTFAAPEAGSVTIGWYGGSTRRPALVASGHHTFRAAGRATMTLTPAAACSPTRTASR